jgi:hypothetical protein
MAGRGEQSQPPDAIFPAGLDVHDLLEYNATYRVLICRQCQYAIQKSALRSHLLKHKIYRGKREHLLSTISQLEILEPDCVTLPDASTAPIGSLPVLSGYCCAAAGCGSLYASSKRMRRHWSEVHGLSESIPDLTSLCRAAALQTFFRGTKLRYFEVSPSSDLLTRGTSLAAVNVDHGTYARHGSATDDEEPSQQYAHAPTPQKGIIDRPQTEIPEEPSLAHFNPKTLSYFHHFILKTSLTLPSITTSSPATQYWQTDIVVHVSRHRWLMCGLLAISACHLAISCESCLDATAHVESAMQFYQGFASSWQDPSLLEVLPGFVSSDEWNEMYRLREQVAHMLQCADLALLVSTHGRGIMGHHEPPTLLKQVMVTLWGLAAKVSLPPFGASPDQNEPLAQAYSIHRSEALSGVDGTDYSMGGTQAPPAALEHLRVLPYRMAEAFGEPDDAQDMIATLSAIASLIGCCDAAYASDSMDAAWQGMTAWLNKVSDRFKQKALDLSESIVWESHRSSQCAAGLIVVAHWAVLLVQCAEHRGCWLLEGVAETLLKQIIQRLPEHDLAVRNLVVELVV